MRRTPYTDHAHTASTATATIPSSHQWFPVATTTNVMITEWAGPSQRHLLGLTFQV